VVVSGRAALGATAAATAAAALTLAAGAHQPTRTAAAQAPPPALRVGDRVDVEGAALACRVVRRGGQVTLDCRRGGRQAGTYGTLLSERRAMIVRFGKDRTARVAFTATHRGRARRCH
jgi:hypothetical protein